MYSHPVKSLALFAIVSVTSLFSAADISKILKESNVFKVAKVTTTQLPSLIIKTVYNNTPYDILLVDKCVNSSVILPAGQTVEVNFKVNSQNVRAKGAQYVFKKLDQNGNSRPDQEAYFNFHMVGTNELFDLELYMAGTYESKSFFSSFNAGGSQIGNLILEVSANTEGAKLYSFSVFLQGSLVFQ